MIAIADDMTDVKIASNYTEVLVIKRDPTMILLVKNHAPEKDPLKDRQFADIPISFNWSELWMAAVISFSNK